MAVDVKRSPAFDTDRRLPEPRDLLRICSSLVALASETAFEGSKVDRTLQDAEIEVRLTHSSVKDYLLSDRILSGPAARFSIGAIAANTVITETCLGYLLQFDQSNPVNSETPAEFPLAHAAAQWPVYAYLADNTPRSIWTRLALDLLNPTKEHLSCWLKMQDCPPNKNDSESVEKVVEAAEPLYYASLYGLTPLVRMLLDQKVDINPQGGTCGTPLQAAANNLQGSKEIMLSDTGSRISKKMKPSKSHAEIIRLLVDHGADVKIQGGVWGTALQAAASHGDLEIVEFLLQHGAEVDVEGGYFGSPLQAAAHSGNTKIVQVLLQHGANTDLSAGADGTALQTAAIWGHEEVVRLLLSQGANMNIRGGKFGSPLQAAVYGGFEPIAQMLLASGAEVNSPDGEYRGSALSLAARRGHLGLIKILLAQGAHSETALLNAAQQGHETIVKMLLLTDKESACPGFSAEELMDTLQAAAMTGSLDMVQDLVSRGAEVNRFGGTYRLPIHAAAWTGHYHIVQFFLDRGVDANAEDAGLGSSLYLAATGGPTPDQSDAQSMTRDDYDDLLLSLYPGETAFANFPSFRERVRKGSPDDYFNVLRLLLANGAQVNKPTGYYGNALQAASFNGHEPSVRLLLEHGAAVNARGGFYETALQAACASGHTAIVQLLLPHGTSVDIQGSKKGSALHAAAIEGHAAILKLLLDQGADYTMRVPLGNGDFKILTSPLHLAAGFGGEAVVRLLLDQGADPNIADNFRSTPLHSAVVKGQDAAVKLLLARGADINRTDCFGQTALRVTVEQKQRRVQDLILDHMDTLGLTPSKSDLEFNTSTESVCCAVCNNCMMAVPVDEEFYQCKVCEDIEYEMCPQCVGLFMNCPRGHRLTSSCLRRVRDGS